MDNNLLIESIDKLQNEFSELNFTPYDSPLCNSGEKMYKWPGPADEDILLCVHKSGSVREVFHRHEFFYFNYTYRGQYDSLSNKFDHQITIQQDELYAGQPYSAHALCVHDNQETIIFGVLIQRETFYRSFLPLLSANSALFRFFLDPSTNCFSDEYIHLKIEDNSSIRSILEMMIIEYAHKKADTQAILKPLVLAFLMQITRQVITDQQMSHTERLSEQLFEYMSQHVDTITLSELANRFSYHPNYISSLLRRELGKSFSELITDLRMQRAILLLKSTTYSIEEIASLLGYSDSSNFHKAFKSYFGHTPRQR